MQRPERTTDDGAPGLDQLMALVVQTPVILAGNLIGMALVAWFFAPVAPAWVLGPWLAASAALWGVRLAHYLRFRQGPAPSDDGLRLWRRTWVLLVLCQAALWGAAPWLFWAYGSSLHQVVLLLVVFTYCLASVQLLSTQARVFLAFVGLVLVPTILRVATDTSEPLHLQLAVVLALMFCVTLLMARTYRSALGRALESKSRTDELAHRLRTEKAVAEEARRAAEAANRAKTQFFAAASHDLRQPLHALGLFAEALRQRTHDPEVASLVHSIDESVDALEGLFGELLDVTRIDAGGVDVNPGPVRMRELFARLRLQFEPVAFEKGLMLSFRGDQHVAHADAVLLERVLRNLVSNAIRYTDDGGVLVSCRLRRRPEGERLLLQVWDSGAGIAPDNLPRIWDEFFQVQGGRQLQAHHRKGLGLGLAIVRRLTDLMGVPVSVRSRVGHGTVFSVAVPTGRVPRALDPPPSAASPALGLTLRGRFILVVEDDPAVREALEMLLKTWDAQVLSFEGVGAVQDWLRSGPGVAPDLLLVDYRLPDGQTGIDVLRCVRAHWQQRAVPAILITGSSLGGHEEDAERHDYHLLIKPVLPSKLRAMIAFKLSSHPRPGA